MLCLAGVGLPVAPANAEPAPPTRILLVAPRVDADRAQQIRFGCEQIGKGEPVECRLVETAELAADRWLTQASTEPPSLIVAMLDPAGFTSGQVSQIESRSIPVVAVDIALEFPRPVAFIGVNNRDLGRKIAEALHRFRPEGGTYSVITDSLDQPISQERLSGLVDGLRGNWTPGRQPVIETAGDADRAADRVAELLRPSGAGASISAIVSLGAWPMLSSTRWPELVAANRVRIERRETLLIFADALPAQVVQLRDGQVHALVSVDAANLGAAAARIARKLAQRAPVPRITYVPIDILTRDKVKLR